MRRAPHESQNRQIGFSLVEMLVVIAVIGILAAMAIAGISNIREAAMDAVAKQNAKNVAQMSEALGALGVAHVLPESMGGSIATARLLREGVTITDGPMEGETFVLSGMSDDDIEAAAAYLQVEYGETYLWLVFQEPPEESQTMFDMHHFNETMQLCARRGLPQMLAYISLW